ncbi:hypothetical protein DD238_008487 [Peronospora effusa]|uniref:Uncharacterized protein n=1 Tax=Peronospora effusa TaxID=542832 RepID=A0A3M6V7T2_9STRA|nr:hypothetical protein DD238_008487 [Peronospora effusa]
MVDPFPVREAGPYRAWIDVDIAAVIAATQYSRSWELDARMTFDELHGRVKSDRQRATCNTWTPNDEVESCTRIC